MSLKVTIGSPVTIKCKRRPIIQIETPMNCKDVIGCDLKATGRLSGISSSNGIFSNPLVLFVFNASFDSLYYYIIWS